MAEALLSLQDIRVNYGDATILRLAALSVYSGEVLALIGPNGSGKSTHLRVMALCSGRLRAGFIFMAER